MVVIYQKDQSSHRHLLCAN